MKKRRLGRLQMAGAALVMALTLLLMGLFYNAQFSVDASTAEALAEAIQAHGSQGATVTVLARQEAEGFLYVLYQQANQQGLAVLEEGVFGNYRFRHKNNTSDLLYGVSLQVQEDRDHLLIYGTRQLDRVYTYQVFDAGGGLLYWGGTEEAPFLRLVEVPSGRQLGFERLRYFDVDGKEIRAWDLRKQMGLTGVGGGSGTSAAELWLLDAGLWMTFLTGVGISLLILKQRTEE